jgi:hypothetical protein
MTVPIRQPGYIRELCMALAHRWVPERIFVVLILTAYMDESGTHGGSPITVMGGMLANAGQWQRFEYEFSKLKRKHKFQIWHTKKFKKSRGDFKGWTDQQRLALLRELLPIVENANAFTEGVTVTLDNADYEANYRGGETPRKLRIESKYGLCFRNCLIFFILEALKRVRKGRLPKLHFVLESGHPNAGEALDIFNEMKRDLREQNCDLLGDLTFSDKDECDPLMMADFLSHWAYLMWSAPAAQQQSLIQDKRKYQPQEKHSGVTHLMFKPGGLAELKATLADRLKARLSSPGRSFGKQRS